MPYRPRTERRCDCGGEVFSVFSPYAPPSSPESADGNGCNKPAQYPEQSRASRAGSSGAKDQGGDRNAKSHRRLSAAARRWPSELPVHRRPECAAIPTGLPPRSAIKVIRAMDGTSDSTTSSAADDGVKSGGQVYAVWSPRTAGCTNRSEEEAESVGAVTLVSNEFRNLPNGQPTTVGTLYSMLSSG